MWKMRAASARIRGGRCAWGNAQAVGFGQYERANMIFYFTGTGNSLYVARELAAGLGESDVRSIAHELRGAPCMYEDVTCGAPQELQGAPCADESGTRNAFQELQVEPRSYEDATCGVPQELQDAPCADGHGMIDSLQDLQRKPCTYEDDVIIIVSPVYYHELPDPVKEFIRASTYACKYFAIVGTYGNRHGGFAELTRCFLEEQGLIADYINAIVMVDNALPGYDIAEQLRIDPEKRVDEQIAQVIRDLRARRTYAMPVAEEDLAHHFRILAKGKMAPTDDNPLYVVTDACVGCGTCAKVCPMDCISLVDERASHAYARCAVCMACIHACPTQAIQFATLREKNPGVHYRNPHVTLEDLIAANN